MHSVITLLIIVVVALAGYFIPKKYNEYFCNEYHENIVSMPLAIATAVPFFLWLLLMDLGGFWFWSLLVVSIVFCIVSVTYAIHIGLQAEAGAFEIAFAVFSQILATAGVAILLLGVLAVFMELFDGKKKKRK